MYTPYILITTTVQKIDRKRSTMAESGLQTCKERVHGHVVLTCDAQELHIDASQ